MGGITNNEVKFLVTLGINEEKSKAKIDSFLKKINKNQKFTFNVNVGESNRNIKTFLDNQKDKIVKLKFDVSSGESKKNISQFLTKQEQSKKSLIFYVNEQATKASVNSALKKIEFNSAGLSLIVNHVQSQENVNRFITMTKFKKLPIELTLSKDISLANINTSISQMAISKIKLQLSLDKDSFTQINSTVKDKKFTGIKTIMELDVAKTKARITEQINKMTLPKFKVDVVANVKPVVATPTVKTVGNQKIGTPKESANDNIYSGNKLNVIKQIKEEYKEAGQQVKLFSSTVAKGEEDFIRGLKKQGNQLDITRDAQTQEITKITATYRNSANEIQKTFYTPLIAKYNTLNAKTNEATKEVRGFVAQVEKIKNTETIGLQDGIHKFNERLIQAKHSSTILAKEYSKFGKMAKEATSNDQLAKLNRDLDDHISDIKRRNELDKARISLINQRNQALANLTRTTQLYARSVSKEEANNIKNLLNSELIMTPINSKPKDLYKLDMGDIGKAKEQLSAVSGQVQSLNARATEATKNSMGIISALKVAMEKFPINIMWE